MGLDYRERKYYEDPKENEDFINIYASRIYCIHGQPSYYPCFKCKRDNEIKNQKKYKKCKEPFDPFRCFDDSNEYHRSEINENLTCETQEPQFNNLKKSNSFEDLKKEYHKLCKVHHPDKGGDEETFKQLNNLYHCLEEKF